MPVLTLLSTAHIQRYLFERSSRLLESIGASKIVEQVFDDWENHDNKLFIGGGHAALEFPDLPSAQAAVYGWSRAKLNDAPSLRIVAAHQSFLENGLAKAFLQAQEQLEECSSRTPYGSPLGALPIVRTCPSTALAAECWDGQHKRNQWISREAFTKRHRADAEHDNRFPKDLDDFGNHQIALVHVDGNSIGSEMQGLVERCQGQPDDAFRLSIRSFSTALTKLARDARDHLIEDVTELCKRSADLTPSLDFLPLRPLVGAGDDVTWVTQGRIGLALAARHLDHFERLSRTAILSYGSTKKNLTASAGVLVMPLKYPFGRGYRIAEALTAEAKRKGRQSGGGSWIDFHVLLESASGSLERLRRDYQIDSSHNLLKRPYRLDGDWKELEKIWAEFKTWPRSAAKDLWEALSRGPEETRAAVERNRVRGRNLPNPGGTQPWKEGWAANRTPYFDPLEILDLHVCVDWDRHEVLDPSLRETANV